MLFLDFIRNNNFDCTVLSKKSKNFITNVVLNSKDADEKNVFVAVKGFKTDGHKFINSAFENGCRDFIIEDKNFATKNIIDNSTILQVRDCRKALADLSSIIFDFPYNKIKMIGITGSKGKTTVTNLIFKLISTKFKSCMFSTIKNTINGIERKAIRTTMESNELNYLLNECFLFGEKTAVVEVSSHAVTLKRVENIEWDIGIFTSFSRDHLDLYGTMENYFEAKLDFFRALNKSRKKNKIAIINMDDPKGKEVASIFDNSVKVIKVGSNAKFDYYIKKFSYKVNNTEIVLISNKKKNKIFTKMRGDFNIINISLAVVLAKELGISIDDINEKLKDFEGVEGRFEIVINNPFSVIIDYAHTPVSLENILFEAKKISKNRVILIFGCTGDRDKEKRSIMGEIAALNSSYTYITNDDTYSEDPNEIAFQIKAGFDNLNKKINENYEIILDRKSAILKALKNAKMGDVIVIAGMGHQKVQILKEKTINYNDKETVLELLKNIGI